MKSALGEITVIRNLEMVLIQVNEYGDEVLFMKTLVLHKFERPHPNNSPIKIASHFKFCIH